MDNKKLLEKLEELFIRFNTSPKTYQKIDYLKLLKFLQALLNNSDYGALHEQDLKTFVEQSLIGKGENISLKTIDGQSLIGEGDIHIQVQGETLQKITYAELKDLRDNAQLTPGIQYQITDYTTTSTESETECAGHLFDIIVTADSESVLNESARACQHKGETYFINSNLAAWELKYCLDNDSDRFGWADEQNGKGVIYRLTDERKNSCPFDFKNIKFKYNLGNNYSPYVYTFSIGVNGTTYDGRSTDYSMSDIYYIYDNYVGDNHMKVYHSDQWIHGTSGTSASGYGAEGMCIYTDVLQLPFIYFIGPMIAGSNIAPDSCLISFTPEKIKNTTSTYNGQAISARTSYVSRCAVQNFRVTSSTGVGSWEGYRLMGGNSNPTLTLQV